MKLKTLVKKLAAKVRRPTPCRHNMTGSETVWIYGTPDSSGWDRTCKLCGCVQHGTFPGMV